jgi:hypothetical protein
VEIERRYAARTQELIHHVSRHIGRYRETDPYVAPSLRENLRRHAYQLAFQVDERSARIAPVDRRVGLQKILVAPASGPGPSALSADDAHRHRLTDHQRIAHCQDHIADFHLVGVADGNRGQAGLLDLENCDVGRRIGHHDFCREPPPVAHDDFNLVGAVHHVIVSQNVSVGADDRTRAKPAGRQTFAALGLPALIPAPRLKSIVVRQAPPEKVEKGIEE